jgi:hypothetical protein
MRVHLRWSRSAAALALALVLLTGYQASLRAFPFHFIWDMDQVTTVDLLLIGGGSLPVHVHHTGFGMYLLLGASSRVARGLGVVSALNLSELDGALCPLACVAELADYARAHSPWLCLAIVLVLWAAAFPAARPRGPATVLALAALGAQDWLFYHAAMIRTELHSLFWWGLAVLAGTLAGRTAHPVRRNVCVFMMGLTIGLAVLTKAQSMGYAVAAVLWLALAIERGGVRPVGGASAAQARRLAALGVLVLAVFVVLLGYAWALLVSRGMATFTDSYGLSPLAGLMLAALVALPAAQYVLIARGRSASPAFGALGHAVLLLVGFVACFGLHFLVYPRLGRSWEYLLLDFKMLFLRTNYYGQTAGGVEAIGRLAQYAQERPVALLVHLAVLAVLATRLWRTGARRALALAGACSAVAVAGLAFACRPILRDLLWAEALMNFLTVAYGGWLLAEARADSATRKAVVMGAWAILLAANAVNAAAMRGRLDANYNVYGWEPRQWTHAVFGEGHLSYAAVMERWRDRAPDGWRAEAAAARFAARHREARRLASFVFRNQALDMTRLGPAAEGCPVWRDAPEWRIRRLPDRLRCGMVVDSRGAPAGRSGFFKPELVHGHSEARDKSAPAPPEPAAALLRRADVRLYLFAPTEDLPRLRQALRLPGPAEAVVIELGRDEKTRECAGLELPWYSVIPLRLLSREMFFLVEASIVM